MKLNERGLKIIGTLVAFTLILLIGASKSQNSDTLNVSITVSSVLAIDVDPNETSFTLDPGSASNEFNFIVKNIGSATINKIKANVTMATSNPYGTASSSNFDAGDFILITNDSSETQPFYYVSSIFYNESKPDYVTPPNGWSEGWNSGYFIRIRTVNFNGTGEGEEYYAFTNASVNGNCSDGKIIIGLLPHTRTRTGTTDFSSGSDYIEFTLTSNSAKTGGWTALSGFGSKLDNHYIYVNASCDYVVLYRWNLDVDGETNNGGGDYLFQGTLNPGEYLNWKLEARVPYGVAAGSLKTGVITFIAE